MKKLALIFTAVSLSLNAFTAEHFNNSVILTKRTLSCTASDIEIEVELNINSKDQVMMADLKKVAFGKTFEKFKSLETQDGYNKKPARSSVSATSSGPGDGKGISSVKFGFYTDQTYYPDSFSKGLSISIDGFRNIKTKPLVAGISFFVPKPNSERFQAKHDGGARLDCQLE